MREWLWAGVAAVVAGLSAMAADLGGVVWSGLVATGVVAAPTCSDVVVIDATSSAALCVQPMSLILIALAVPVTVAVVAGAAARKAALRLRAQRAS